MNYITIEQIKAARALLNWNQQNLADASGLSKPAIANLERATVTPRKSTVDAIYEALIEAGVEFTKNHGVKLRTQELKVQVWEGSDAIIRLWDDVLATQRMGDERYVSGNSVEKFVNAVGRAQYDYYLDLYKRRGLRGYALVREGDTNFGDTTANYRWLPEEYFVDVPGHVYGDTYAMITWEPEIRIVVIKNQVVADSFKKQFLALWDKANVPSGYNDRF